MVRHGRRQPQLTATLKVGATVSHLTRKIPVAMSTHRPSSEVDVHALTQSTRAQLGHLGLPYPHYRTNRSCAAAGLHQFARLAIFT